MCAFGFCSVLMATLGVTPAAMSAPIGLSLDEYRPTFNRDMAYSELVWGTTAIQAAPTGSTALWRSSHYGPDRPRSIYTSGRKPATADNFGDDMRRRIEQAHGELNNFGAHPRRMMRQAVSGRGETDAVRADALSAGRA